MELFLVILVIGFLILFVIHNKKSQVQKGEDFVTLIRHSNNGFEPGVLDTEQFYFYDGAIKQKFISGCHVYIESDKYNTTSGEFRKKNIIKVPSKTVVWTRNITFDEQNNRITKLQSSIRTSEDVTFIKRTLADIKSDINKRDEAIEKGVFNDSNSVNILHIYLNIAIVDIGKIHNVQKS